MGKHHPIGTNCEAIIQSAKKQIIMDNVFSDEFLRTFCGKKYEPCHGFSDGKHSALDKEKVVLLDTSVVEMTKKEEVVLSSNRLLRHSIPRNSVQTGEVFTQFQSEYKGGITGICRNFKNMSSNVFKRIFLNPVICRTSIFFSEVCNNLLQYNIEDGKVVG